VRIRLKIVFRTVFVIASSMQNFVAASAQEARVGPPARTIETLEMTRGRTFRHPTKSGTCLKVISSREAVVTRGQQPGLYVSEDSGVSWRLRCKTFDFLGPFFIHPTTGRMFAAIYDTLLAAGTDGYLEKRVGFRIVTSEDGVRWRDISGERGLVATVGSIFQDPDEPERVCIHVGGGVRSYVLQAVDNQYSSWLVHDTLESVMRFFPGSLRYDENVEKNVESDGQSF